MSLAQAATVIFGANIDPTLQEEVVITLIATGFVMTNTNNNSNNNAKKAMIDEKLSNMTGSKEEASYSNSNEFNRKPEVIDLEDDADDNYYEDEEQHPVETIEYQENKRTVPVFISRLFGGGKKR